MAYTKQEIAVYEKIRFRIVGTQVFAAFWAGILLVALKLTGELELSWWKTTAPLWIAALQFFATAIHIAALRNANTQAGQQ